MKPSVEKKHNFQERDALRTTMGSETSKDSGSSHGWSSHSQPYTTDVAAFEAEQIKMREISRMDQTIRSRLHQGVKYNMKVVLCGERGTGKTMLWRRLQGQRFRYESATINWTSPMAGRTAAGKDDVVKVEVWDVVDQAIVVDKVTSESVAAEMVYNLTGEAEEGRHSIVPLDASIVDIYKDCHAVIFMINPFDKKSLQYVREKYPQVPGHLSILLIVNFKDKTAEPASSHSPSAVVSLKEVQIMCAEIKSFRSNCANDDVTVLETSLLDCYGLLNLHHYLDVPFLRLKQRMLQEQLASVEYDLQLCHADMECKINSGNSYEEYLRQYNARKRERMQQQGDVINDNKPSSSAAAVDAVAVASPAAALSSPPASKLVQPMRVAPSNVPPVPPVVVPPHPQYKITTTSTVATATANTNANIDAPSAILTKAVYPEEVPPPPAAQAAAAVSVSVSVSVTDTSDTPNPTTQQIDVPNSDSTTSQYGGSVAPYEPSPYAPSDDSSGTPLPTGVTVTAPPVSVSETQAEETTSVDVANNNSLSYSDDGKDNINGSTLNSTISVAGAVEDEDNPVSRGASPVAPVETSVSFEAPPSVDGDALLDSFLAQEDEEEEKEVSVQANHVHDQVKEDHVAAVVIGTLNGEAEVTGDHTNNTNTVNTVNAAEEADSDASDGSPVFGGSKAHHNKNSNGPSSSRPALTAIKKLADSDSSDDDEGGERGNMKLNQKVNFGGKLLRSVKSATLKSPTASVGPSSGGLRKARPSGNKAGHSNNVSSNSEASGTSNAVLKGATDLEEVDL